MEPNRSMLTWRRVVSVVLTVLAMLFIASAHDRAIATRVMLSAYFIGILGVAYVLVRCRAMLLMEVVVCAAVGRTLAGVYFATRPGIADPVLVVMGDLTFWFVVLYLGWRLVSEAYRFQEREIRRRVKHDIDERASAVRGTALVTTSREIRQPLATMRTLTDALLNDPNGSTDETQQDALADMDRCIGYLMGLVDGLCEYGQAEAGLIQLHYETVSLPELLQQCVATVRSQTVQNQVQIHSHVAPEVAEMVADPLRLKQVFLALLSNAVRSNKEGGVVSIQTRPHGRDVLVSVRDTGKGMSDEGMAALFDPYREDTHDNQQVCASLGLSLAKRLVEMHGGTLIVDSVADSGTVFTVRLPKEAARDASRRGDGSVGSSEPIGAATAERFSVVAAPAGATAPSPMSSRGRETTATGEPGEGGAAEVTRVLVADANASVRRVLRQWLKSLECDMVETDNGPGVIELAHARPAPHVIMLDANLPQMSGFEVCRAIKGDNRLQMIPIILVAPADSPEEKTRAFEAGADDFLVKPINRAELNVRMGALLRIYRFTQELIGAESVAMSLAKAVAAKDGYSQAHISKVADYAVMLGEKLGLEVSELKSLKYGAILHNVGKIAIPDAVLEKTGPLTPREMAIFQRHPEIGCEICTPLKPLKPVLAIIRHHKEHWNGNGYPDRLAGDEIPLGAQIVGLVDAYVALVSNRPYRKAMSPDEAVAILRKQTAEGWYNPELVDRFLECLNRSEQDRASESAEALVPADAT
jgi:putative two-component system response regulator